MMPGLVAGALLAPRFPSMTSYHLLYFRTRNRDLPSQGYSRRAAYLRINAASTVLIVITVVAAVLARNQAPEKSGKVE
jgi:ABC-type spermidine/putrescine transport system permease subunit II